MAQHLYARRERRHGSAEEEAVVQRLKIYHMIHISLLYDTIRILYVIYMIQYSIL